ncbi:S-layer homology domain-containing protein [Bacillus songklensis]|uniref:S-layer homology domain-containing protein n=1 Tax=Bacillus songklensis TaxID=1069116 RepID=A0ABV8B4W6_9BACI
MKQKFLSMGLVAALISSALPTASFAAAPTLNDIPNKKQGEAVTIQGKATSSDVIIKVVDPNNLNLFYDSVQPSNNGDYSSSFTLPVNAETGTYQIVAGQGSEVATDKFIVFKASGEGTQNISIEDVQSKKRGETLVIRGQSTFSEVTIKVVAPNNTVLYFDIVQPNDQKQYEASFALPQEAELGTYTIVAGKDEEVATDTFTVIQSNGSGGNNGGGNSGGGSNGGSRGGSGSSGGTTTPSAGGKEPYVKEEKQTDSKGQASVVAKVDNSKVEEFIKNNPKSKALEISMPKVTGNEKAKVEISAETFNLLNEKDQRFTVELKGDVVSYTLPASEINVEAIAQSLGVQGKDVKLSITMNETTDTTGAIKKNNLNLAAKVVEFKIGAVAGSKMKEIDRFTQYVEREITMSKTVNPNRATAVRLNDDGTVSAIPTKFEGNKAIFKSLTNSKYTVVENTVTYKDLEQAWNREDIETLASKFIIKGYEDGTFRPNNTTTRLQLALLLTRSLGLTTDKQYDGRFKDVSADSWYTKDIMAAVEAGIITGKEDGTFAPFEPVKREQAAAMIKRALNFVTYDSAKLDQSKKLDLLKDKEIISPYAQKDIEFLLQAGIMSGKNDGSFDPRGGTTRAQIAKMLHRALTFANLM